MSLRLWMPLNGDTKNYGASIATIINNKATVNTAGKIGSCYVFNNSDSYISIDNADLRGMFTGGSRPFSFAFWVYHADASRAIIFGDYSLSGAINFNIELTVNHTVRFYWGADPDYTFANSAVALNDWTHVVITYSGTELCCYLNGNLVNTRTGVLSTKNKTSGVFYLGRDARTGTTTLNGRLNDFRVYNHCLSLDEIKEISNALVVHYPLNNADAESTTNLLGEKSRDFTEWRSYGFGSYGVKTIVTDIEPALSGQVCQVTDGSDKTTAHNVEMATSFGGGPALENGDKVTLSAYVKGSENTIGKNCFIHVYCTNGTNTQSDSIKNITLTDEWQRVSGQFTWRYDNPSGTTYNVYVVCQMTTGQYFYFSNVQFEDKDHVTPYTPSSRNNLIVRDCSGYNRDGSSDYQGAMPVPTSDSARNLISYHFDSDGKHLLLNSSFLPAFSTGSVSWWAKITTNGTSGTLPFTGQTTGYYLAASSNWTGAFYNGNVTASGTIKYYIDGVEDNTPPGADSKWHFYTVTGINLSGWTALKLNNYSAAWNAKDACYSDIKFYNTVLSADYINKEYHRYAAIFKNHSFASNEIIEDDSVSIGINGVLKGNLVEGDYTKVSFFPSSGNAQAAEFIELI